MLDDLNAISPNIMVDDGTETLEEIQQTHPARTRSSSPDQETQQKESSRNVGQQPGLRMKPKHTPSTHDDGGTRKCDRPIARPLSSAEVNELPTPPPNANERQRLLPDDPPAKCTNTHSDSHSTVSTNDQPPNDEIETIDLNESFSRPPAQSDTPWTNVIITTPETIEAQMPKSRPVSPNQKMVNPLSLATRGRHRSRTVDSAEFAAMKKRRRVAATDNSQDWENESSTSHENHSNPQPSSSSAAVSDDAIRRSWGLHSPLQVFSRSRGRWFDGFVTELVDTDEEDSVGVQYYVSGDASSKRRILMEKVLSRFHTALRPATFTASRNPRSPRTPRSTHPPNKRPRSPRHRRARSASDPNRVSSSTNHVHMQSSTPFPKHYSQAGPDGFVEGVNAQFPRYAHPMSPPISPPTTPRYDGPYYRSGNAFYAIPSSPHPQTQPYSPYVDTRVSQLQDQIGKIYSFMENIQAQMRQSQHSRQDPGENRGITMGDADPVFDRRRAPNPRERNG